MLFCSDGNPSCHRWQKKKKKLSDDVNLLPTNKGLKEV